MGAMSPVDTSNGLGLRRTPAQQRSRERMELLVEHAGSLVAEVGTEAFTTERLATAAGVPVGSVYQFFGSKHAVILEVARRQHDRLMTELAATTGGSDWKGAVDDLVERLAKARKADPSVAVVRAATLATPELADAARALDDEAADAMSDVLQRLRPALGKPVTRPAARVLMAAVRSGLDVAHRSERADRASINEVKALARAYVGALGK